MSVTTIFLIGGSNFIGLTQPTAENIKSATVCRRNAALWMGDASEQRKMAGISLIMLHTKHPNES